MRINGDYDNVDDNGGGSRLEWTFNFVAGELTVRFAILTA
jgi:hypothetical protein